MGVLVMNYYVAPGIIRAKLDKRSPSITAERVIYMTMLSFNLTLNDIRKKTRRREIVYPRHVLCYLLRKKTNMSLKDIGELTGGRDHTTVIHAIKSIEDLMETDELIRLEISFINNSI